MPILARFRPHQRGFGFATPLGDDRTSEVELSLPGPSGAPISFDRIFVPPPATRELIADDLVEIEVEVDAKGASAASIGLVQRPRRMLVGRVQQGPGRLVVDPDPQLGTSWVALDPQAAERLRSAVGRQVVVLLATAEDGAPIARAVVAGPHVVGSPQAVRAAAVVVTLGRVAPELVPGGPGAAGLDPVEATTTHERLVGLLAGGARGGAAGLDASGAVPGAEAPWTERRDEPCVTIDSPEARDLDDAVAATWDGQASAAVHVAVHIADVARAVGVGSPADHYARTVASSAYLTVGDNAPMLDPALSEGALSLLPDEDRWALSARFSVAADGTLEDVEVELSAMRSRAKLSYGALEDWLAGDATRIAQESGTASSEVEAVLAAAKEAARRLGVQRDGRVTLEALFEQPELQPAVVDGRLTTVAAEPHVDAYRLVERLMVAANEAVAHWLVDRRVPALYRAHQGLDPERLQRLLAALELAGAQVTGLDDGEGTGQDGASVIAGVIAEIDRLDREGQPAERDLLESVAAATSARATYEPDPSAHTGLAAAAYTHFTSPIRRYADLVVHRQIRAALGGDQPLHTVDELGPLAGWLDARAGAIGHLQARERAELWSVLLDRGLLHDPEPATVTRLTSAGLRIRLPRLGITGFVRAEQALGHSDGKRASLAVDEHGLTTTSGPWRVGSRVEVEFVGLDPTGRPDWRLARPPA